MTADRLVVGITGGRGIAFGVRLLETLAETPVETHLVLTKSATTALDADAEAVKALADQVYAEDNQAARISSGSFLTKGMVVVPCDSRSLAAIAMGLATNLVYRAADVTLKERRPLVLGLYLPTSTTIDRENISRASEVPGLAVLPLEGPVDAAVAALLAQFGIDHELSS